MEQFPITKENWNWIFETCASSCNFSLCILGKNNLKKTIYIPENPFSVNAFKWASQPCIISDTTLQSLNNQFNTCYYYHPQESRHTCCPTGRNVFGSFSIFLSTLRGRPVTLRPLQDLLQCFNLCLSAAHLHSSLPELRLQLKDLTELLRHLSLGVSQLLFQQRDLPRLLANLRDRYSRSM